MTELQEALAIEDTFEDKGTVYRIGAITVEVMGRWQDWLAGETLEALIRINAKRPDGEEKAVFAVGKMHARGDFDYFGEASQERLLTLNGRKKFVFFRVQQHHPDIAPSVIADFVESQWVELYKIMLKQAALRAADPNAEAPGGASQSESNGTPSSPKSSISPDGTSPKSGD